MSEMHQKLKLKSVINASGKMTILGVSKMSDAVAAAQKEAGQSFFIMEELAVKTGAYLAKSLQSEDAQIVSSASAGVAQSVAALIGQGALDHLHRPYDAALAPKREIVIPKGHNVDYGGTPIELLIAQGGGIVCEAGYANACFKEHVAQKITDKTAAILYVKSHHAVQKSMLSLEEAVAVAHTHNVPLIVDAAAEDDLLAYAKSGADLVVFSGAKALEGPSSGLVVGKKKYVEWVRLQSKGIGRAMKAGKESMLGLVKAVEDYLTHGAETGAAMKKRLQPFVAQLNALEGIAAEIVQDSAGRDIYRARVQVAPQLEAVSIIRAQQNGDPAIYTRDYQANHGVIEYDIRAVSDLEMKKVVTRLSDIVTSML